MPARYTTVLRRSGFAHSRPRQCQAAGKIEPEFTLQGGKGGGRADVFLEGPAGELVEFDWKTPGQSGLRSIKQMQKHAGQVRALKNGANLTTQQSRSWTDYVRPLLPKD